MVSDYFTIDIDVGLLNAITSGSPDVIRFLTVMAVCNTVIPAKR